MLHATPASGPEVRECVSAAPNTVTEYPRLARVGMPAKRRWTPTATFLTLLLGFIVLTRWLVAPRYLYYFDSANFALALEKFDPALHQPQPPGYPLFVALMRLIHVFVSSPEGVLLVAGLVAACAATLLIYVLAADMFDAGAGIFAAALLAANPVFWFGGDSNQIRIFLSLSAVGVALLAWKALTRPHQARWLAAMFAALGIAAGFRPAEVTLLLPMAAWVWWRSRTTPHRFLAALMLPLTALPWIVATCYVVGGPARYLSIMSGYTDAQFQGSSWFYGASLGAAWQMLRSTIAWHLYGPLVWIWVLFFIPWRSFSQARRNQAILLALAFLPSFLFCGFIHIGDPDQALASISILCVAGGGVVSFFLRKMSCGRFFTAGALLVAVHTILFFVPPYHLARASSRKALRDVDRLTSSAVDAIAELRREGPLTIVHWGSPVASRQLEYYFPEDYVDVLPGSPGQAAPNESPMVFYRHGNLPPPGTTSGLMHPGTRRILCLLPANAAAAALPGWTRHGPVYVMDSTPDEGITLGGYRISPAIAGN